MKLVTLGILMLSLAVPQALAQSGEAIAGKTYTASTSVFIQPKPTIMSLIRTDREPRSWTTLKLWPGAETSHFYTELQPNGSIITKEANHKIDGVRDDRPMRESRPNWYYVGKIASLSVPPMVGLLVALAGIYRNR